ncbi:MAG TPA: hypothetical protein VGD65_25420 [Chryseosolibacter sp.]
MKTEIIRFIQLFSFVSVVIPLIAYLTSIKKAPKQHHFIGALILISGLTDLSFYLRIYTSPMLSNLYSIMQFGIITGFYYNVVYKKRAGLAMSILIGVYVAILLFSLINYGIRENLTFLWAVGSLIIAIHCLSYVFNVNSMVLDRYFDIHLLSNVIFNTTFFGYGTMTFFIFLLTNIVFSNHDAETIDAFWSLHNIINILKNIGFAIGFYYIGKREIYMTLSQLEEIAQRLREEEMLEQ